jgi:ribosome-associated protein
MLAISRNIILPECEIDIQAIRSQGAGGQNVNKVATAIHLRFDIGASSLPEIYKQRLMSLRDSRIDKSGVVHIKSQEFRTQERNKQAALNRLRELIQQVTVTPKKRIATKVPRQVKRKRLDHKSKRGELKSLRKKISRQD